MSEAHASARLCRQLEAQLVEASRDRPSSRSRKYDAAIERQRTELQRARARARQSGCVFGFLGGEACGTLNIKIARMQDNLAGLQAERERLGSGGSSRKKDRILAQISRNGCREQQAAERSLPRPVKETRKGPTLLDQILGRAPRLEEDGLGAVLNREPSDRQLRASRRDENLDRTTRGRSYRTFCVRTCDGYFFPMSPASTQSDFPRDQQNCESACPGTDMRVYYRGDEGDDATTMMSVAGDAPYSELPMAFAYRSAEIRKPICGCQAIIRSASIISPGQADDGQQAGALEQANEPVTQSSSIVVMQPRQDDAAVPEASPVDDEALQRLLRQKANPVKPGERKIRVVGPVFLPDPEEATDLRVPGPAPVQ